MSKQSHLNPQSNYRNKIRSQTGATLKVAPYLIILSQLFFSSYHHLFSFWGSSVIIEEVHLRSPSSFQCLPFLCGYISALWKGIRINKTQMQYYRDLVNGMAPYSPLPALSCMTGMNQKAGSALPHAFRYQSIKCGRGNCSAVPSLKAAPCRSRSPEEVPGRFGSAVSPLVGSAENWWSKEEPQPPNRWGKEGDSLPLPLCSCHPCSTRPAV